MYALHAIAKMLDKLGKICLSLETPVFGCTAPPIKHEQVLVRSMHWKIALERLS